MQTRTTSSMLDGLLDPANEAVWRQFDERYRPILFACARRLGLSREDAADAAQDALVRFLTAFRAGSYDRTRGRLSSWLAGIARHAMLDVQHRRSSRREARGLSAIDGLTDDEAMAAAEAAWNAECEREILCQALRRLRAETRTEARTLQAFEMLALQGLTPAVVAETLGVTLHDVYQAKHRCLALLRALVVEIRDAYETM